MHVLEFCFYGSGVIYAFLYEPKLIYIFITLLSITLLYLKSSTISLDTSTTLEIMGRLERDFSLLFGLIPERD